jgi:hypothetical protein
LIAIAGVIVELVFHPAATILTPNSTPTFEFRLYSTAGATLMASLDPEPNATRDCDGDVPVTVVFRACW